MPVHHKIVAGLRKSVRKFRRSEVGGIIRKAVGKETIQELEQRGRRPAPNGRTRQATNEAARQRGVPKARVVSPKDMVRGKGVLR